MENHLSSYRTSLSGFAITNPGPDAHKEKVKTEAAKAIDKATETSDNNFFTQSIRSIAKMMAGSAIDEVMNQLFEYHNYIVCSKEPLSLMASSTP